MRKTIVPKSENKLALVEAGSPPCVAAKPTGVPKNPSSHASPATVVVKYDAGWGNSLTLRGEGPGLSWNVGTPLRCVEGDKWVWAAPAAGTIMFKVMYNDCAWSLGENIVAGSGETVTITPEF